MQNSPAAPVRRVHYVLSTHWDREWYQTFQDYRYRFVRLIDRIIAGWERGLARGPFQTDGQAISWRTTWRCARSAARGGGSRGAAICHRPLVRAAGRVPRVWRVVVRNLRLGRQLRARSARNRRTRASCATCSATTARCPRFSPVLGSAAASSGAGMNHADPRSCAGAAPTARRYLAYRFGRVGYCELRLQGARCPRTPCRTGRRHGCERIWTPICAGGRATRQSIRCCSSTAAITGMGPGGLCRAIAERLGERADEALRVVHTSAGRLSGRGPAPAAEKIGIVARRRAPRARLASGRSRRAMVDSRRCFQPGLDQAGQCRLPDAALPVGGAFQRAGQPGAGPGVSAGFP